MNKRKKRLLLIVIAVLIVAAIFIIVFRDDGSSAKETIKLGFIMTGQKTERGWNEANYKGIKAACDSLDIELVVKENVKEFTGRCKEATEELINDGAEIVILSSYGYAEEVIDIVDANPDIVFLSNSAYLTRDNLIPFFARLYQVRYLEGMLAGMVTQTGHIGYIAAMDNSEVNRGINAFALGVRKTAPQAVVDVIRTGSWDDREMEMRAVEILCDDKNADVFAYHQNQPNVIEECERRNIFSLGYNMVYGEAEKDINPSSKYLTAGVCNWTKLYTSIIKDYIKNNCANSENYWIGIDREAVELAFYSEDITEAMKKVLDEAVTEMIAGKDVFSGIIYDNNGELRCLEDEVISDDELLKHMDWLVEGVELYAE